VRGARDEKQRAEVRVDGNYAPDPSALLTLDPGPHVFEASQGGATAREEKALAEGAGDVTVVLALREKPAAPSGTAPPSGSDGSLVPSAVALALGLAALGVGVTTGVMAAGKAGTVKGRCVDRHCLAADASMLEDARSSARISTVAFVAGGVCVAAAGLFFVWRPGRTSRPVTAMVTPRALAIGATF
jgi:hypothetical protein